VWRESSHRSTLFKMGWWKVAEAASSGASALAQLCVYAGEDLGPCWAVGWFPDPARWGGGDGLLSSCSVVLCWLLWLVWSMYGFC
jgi:hypothetical protein